MDRTSVKHVLLLAAFAVFAVFVGYQVRVPIKMDVGGSNEIYLRGFYSTETDDEHHYRWTNGDARVVFPEVGQAASLAVVVNAYALRYEDRIYTATVTVNGRAVGEITRAGWRNWRYAISDPTILRDDQLVVGFQSATFIHNELYPDSIDDRTLGVRIESVELEPQFTDGTSLLTIPPTRQVLFAILFVLGIYLLWRLLGVRTQTALYVALATLVIFAAVIAFLRIVASQSALFVTLAVGGAAMVKMWRGPASAHRVAKIAIVVGVALVALWLRVHAAGMFPVEGDDGIYMGAAAHYARAIQTQDLKEIILSDLVPEHPHLYLLVFAVAEVGREVLSSPFSSVEAMRLVAVIFGVLQTALIALLNPLAGWFLAIQTTEIKFTSMAYLEALPALTVSLAVIAFERFRRTSEDFWLYLSALALGATGASKFIYLAIGFAIAPFLLWEQRRRLKKILLFGMLAAFAFFALDPYLWVDPVGRLRGMFSFHAAFSTRDYVKELARPWWYTIAAIAESAKIYAPSYIWPLPFYIVLDGLIAWLGFLGLPALARRSWLYVAWLIVGMVFISLWEAKWEQYAMVIITPVCLSAGYGVADALQWVKNRVPNVTTRVLGIRFGSGHA